MSLIADQVTETIANFQIFKKDNASGQWLFEKIYMHFSQLMTMGSHIIWDFFQKRSLEHVWLE